MPRRREDWISEQGRVEKTHANLSDRELVLVIGALIEAALAELLMKRLHGPAATVREMVERMQLDAMMRQAWAVGIISDRQHKMLDAFRQIRNQMAHHINVSLTSEAKAGNLMKLYNLLDTSVRAHGTDGIETWEDIKRDMPTDTAACRLLLRSFHHVLEEEFKKTLAGCVEIESLCGDPRRPDHGR